MPVYAIACSQMSILASFPFGFLLSSFTESGESKFKQNALPHIGEYFENLIHENRKIF